MKQPFAYETAVRPGMTTIVMRPDTYEKGRVCILAHGLNSSGNAPHIHKIAQAYLEHGYTVVAPNLRNSDWNASDGIRKDFTIAAHVDDVRATIEWTKNDSDLLPYRPQRFALAGHSMGGYAVCYLAAREYAEDVSHVLAISPTTSGERSFAARRMEKNHPNGMQTLREEVPMAETEWPTHDIHKHIHLLQMPVAVIVGRDDTLTTPDDIGDFYAALPRPVAKDIVEGEHHCLVGDLITARYAGLLTRLENSLHL